MCIFHTMVVVSCKVLTMSYDMLSYILEVERMSDKKKSTSMSIRVSEDELELFKKAARLESYASYSEFIRRTALIKATQIMKQHEE